MTSQAQRIAFAEILGYQWYKERNGTDVAADYWGITRLALPPEAGIGNLGQRGTVSETRLATAGEIDAAKANNGFYHHMPRLDDLGDVHDHVMALCLHHPDIHEYRSNEYLIQDQLDIISEREQVPPWMFGAELYVEAVIRAAGRWDDNL